MGRNWFETYCEKHNRGFWVLIGSPAKCPDCVTEEKEKLLEMLETAGEGRNMVIIKPGGEREG